MADIAPLTPLRYDLDRVDLARVVAPPYDVIGPEERARLAATDPHNVVELILPEGEGDAKYAHAAELFAAWQRDGFLVRDDQPAFYRYAQTFASPVDPSRRITRRGFLGLVRLAPFSDRVILPHERTLSGPKADRLKLFRSTQSNLSPGFMLYRDPRGEIAHALDRYTKLAAFDTKDGIHHELGKIHDPDAVRAIVEGVGRSALLIADGHHRYETALGYAAEVGESDPLAASRWFMVFLMSEDDPDLLVLPTHRHLHDVAGFDWAKMLEGAKGLFDVRDLARGASASELLGALAAAGRQGPSLVACAKDGAAALLTLRRDVDLTAHAVLGQAAEALRRTDVALLHMGIFESVLGISREAQAAKTNLWYPQDATATLAELRSGKGDALYLMNATPVAQVRAVAEQGEVMPQKSTFFYPKVLTGLAIHTLERGRRVASPGAMG